MKKVTYTPRPLRSSQNLFSVLITCEGVARQPGILFRFPFLLFPSKATPHCCPEWSRFRGAGPAESWGHSAGCG